MYVYNFRDQNLIDDMRLATLNPDMVTIYKSEIISEVACFWLSALWLKYLCVILCVVALPSVTGLQLLDVTHSTMTVKWDHVEGASGYMLLYGPLIEDGQLNEKEVLKQKILSIDGT